MDPERSPALIREAFHCPAPGCGVYASQEWSQLLYPVPGGIADLDEHQVAHCMACKVPSIWRKDVMIYPLSRQGEDPHADMPAAVLAIYEEARSVAPISRKSAAGLLRLALQMLIR